MRARESTARRPSSRRRAAAIGSSARARAQSTPTAASAAWVGVEQLALALAAHDPQRTLERGYVLVQTPGGEPLLSAARVREADEVGLRFASETVPARIVHR